MSEIIPLYLFFLLTFSSLIALAGGLVFLYIPKLSTWLEQYGVPFAAGTLIVASVLGLLPEAEHLIGTKSFAIFALAFLIAFVFEQLFIEMHHHSNHEHHDKKSVKTAVPMVLAGDTIHNFIDGVTIAATYMVNPGLGVVTALSTFLHEVPHEIGDFSILLKAGWQKRNIILVNILSALFTILGAFAVVWFSLTSEWLGYLLAGTAGIFFYLGVVDFLPHAFHTTSHDMQLSHKIAQLFPVLLGGIVMAFSLTLVPHQDVEIDYAQNEGESYNTRGLDEEVYIDEHQVID